MDSIMSFIQVVFFTFILALTMWFFDHIMHRYYCKLAKRLQKPVCRCWDCKDKCSLYHKASVFE